MAVDLNTLTGDALKKEMQRRSLDLLIVHNPLDEPYVVVWDGTERHVIPASRDDRGYGEGNQMVTRYIAEKYMTEMANKIMTMEIDTAVSRENAKRVREGKQPMTKYQGGEQIEFEKRIDDPVRRKEVMTTLFVRVEREYAAGFEEVVEEPKRDTIAFRGADNTIFDEIMNAVADDGEVASVEEE